MLLNYITTLATVPIACEYLILTWDIKQLRLHCMHRMYSTTVGLESCFTNFETLFAVKSSSQKVARMPLAIGQGSAKKRSPLTPVATPWWRWVVLRSCIARMLPPGGDEWYYEHVSHGCWPLLAMSGFTSMYRTQFKFRLHREERSKLRHGGNYYSSCILIYKYLQIVLRNALTCDSSLSVQLTMDEEGYLALSTQSYLKSFKIRAFF